jgi:DNA-binding MarR family transcriptional regulator
MPGGARRDLPVGSPWEARRFRAMIPDWNYLTSEPGGPTMPSRRSESGPDACGILAGLRRIIHSVMDDAEPELESLGLSRKAFFVLEAVEEHPFPAKLARGMHLPPPTVTYLIKQLEAGGFLERRAEPGDLRKFRLVVTESGRSALDRGRRALKGAMADRLRRIDREDVIALDRIVRHLVGPKGGCARP